MSSKDGKGRTLYEILTGRNKRDLTPLELQYHNPLAARVGQVVAVDHDAQCAGVSFVIERISVYETKVRERKFHHTDYHLKGVALDREKPVRLRLRLVPDEDETNGLGSKILLLHHYYEMGWDADFHDGVLGSETGQFDVNHDDDGVELAEPRRYWRIEDVLDPYRARVTVLTDKDGNGVVDEAELERCDVTYWDYFRQTTDAATEQPFVEFLTVEMDDRSHYFTFLRGREVAAFQISVF